MTYPDFSIEKRCWQNGYTEVIGVDEVGRGAVAGPLIAGAAAMRISNFQFPIFKENTNLLNKILELGIDDSKKLTAKRRIQLDGLIRQYFHVGIGAASVGEINRYGIVKATEKAMRRAIVKIKNQRLKIKNKNQKSNIFVVIDAFYVKYIPGIGLKNQRGIIHGDSLSISIAAASIVAKVYRDGLMNRMSNKYKQYGWEQNKGYGTSSHRRAIKVYGVCRHHRRDFVDGWK